MNEAIHQESIAAKCVVENLELKEVFTLFYNVHKNKILQSIWGASTSREPSPFGQWLACVFPSAAKWFKKKKALYQEFQPTTFINIYIYTRVSQSTMTKIKSGSTVTANPKKVSFVHVDTKGEVLPNLNNIKGSRRIFINQPLWLKSSKCKSRYIFNV